MALKLRFKTLDVFTSTRFTGNPLAIVHVPSTTTLTQDQKQKIALEFNLSETVFLQEPSQTSLTDNLIVPIGIFTTTEELPFAGHPTVGTAWYVLSGNSGIASAAPTQATLRTKAGDIPATLGTGGTARVQVPVDFKAHANYCHPVLKKLQPRLAETDYVNGAEGAEAIVSIVKGMTFIMLELETAEALERLQLFPSRLELPLGYLGDWDGYVSVYAYWTESVCDTVTKVRTRMFDGSVEDPATGSAASALASWLATKAKIAGSAERKQRFEIVQGVEMGRRSEIGVMVTLDSEGGVEGVEVEGAAVGVMEGWIGV